MKNLIAFNARESFCKKIELPETGVFQSEGSGETQETSSFQITGSGKAMFVNATIKGAITAKSVDSDGYLPWKICIMNLVSRPITDLFNT